MSTGDAVTCPICGQFVVGLHFCSAHGRAGWFDPAIPKAYPPMGTEPPITLRDWFAGQALAGTLANPTGSGVTDDYVKGAWELADAMLAQRERQP